MNKGITIYPGLDNTPEENLQFLEQAAFCGFTRVFLSLVLPYADLPRAKAELPEILAVARKLHMEIIASLTPEVMRTLHITHLSLSAFRFMGIHTLYLPNFIPEDLAELSRNKHGLRIQFNAAHLSCEQLQKLLDEKPNLSQLEALHSGYARKGTGLSEENLLRRTGILRQAGIHVGAFVPSTFRPRSPFCDGIPSLEMHRKMPADLACRHLAAMGVDSVILSDSMASAEELFAIGKVSRNEILLRAKLLTNDSRQKQLLRYIFTARIDEARDAIRAVEGCFLTKQIGNVIQPENTINRQLGDITIDNQNCTGFMGEVQIIKNPSPASKRTNVAARIPKEEIFLMNYIVPGRKFYFAFS